MTGVMITEGNNFHPADYHAEVTAGKIVVVGEGAAANVVNAARSFRKKVENILLAHHAKVEQIEQAELAAKGAARYTDCPHEAALFATDDAVLREIVDAARGTPLETHFSRPEVQEAILQELHHETRSQICVHRDVHAAARA